MTIQVQIWQHGMCVMSIMGPCVSKVLGDASNYASLYEEDAPITIVTRNFDKDGNELP